MISNEDNRLQLEMFADLQGFKRGKHVLIVKHKKFKNDTVARKKHGTIPFWYYNENAVMATPVIFENSVLDTITE